MEFLTKGICINCSCLKIKISDYPCDIITRSFKYSLIESRISRRICKGREMKKPFRASIARARKRKRRSARRDESYTADRVGAGSLTRANDNVTDREGRRKRGYIQTERRICSRFACIVHEIGRAPLAVFKARNVSRNAAIDYHGPAYRYYRPTSASAYTHTHTHTRGVHSDRATFTNARLAPRYLSLSLYLGHTHTPRTNDTASRIILVPRISSARYCHRERLMFRRNLSSRSLFLLYAYTYAYTYTYTHVRAYSLRFSTLVSPSIVPESEWTRRRRSRAR